MVKSSTLKLQSIVRNKTHCIWCSPSCPKWREDKTGHVRAISAHGCYIHFSSIDKSEDHTLRSQYLTKAAFLRAVWLPRDRPNKTRDDFFGEACGWWWCHLSASQQFKSKSRRFHCVSCHDSDDLWWFNAEKEFNLGIIWLQMFKYFHLIFNTLLIKLHSRAH